MADIYALHTLYLRCISAILGVTKYDQIRIEDNLKAAAEKHIEIQILRRFCNG